MTKYIRLIVLGVALLLPVSVCLAQRSHDQEKREALPILLGDSATQQATNTKTKDSVDKMEYHMSLFSGVYTGWGEAHGYMGAAPSFSYHASDRLTLKAGFAFTTDINSDRYRICGNESRSFAPRRSNNTGAVGVDVAAEYKVNDNLWMAASIYYLGGSYDPIWNRSNRPMDLNVYGGSFALHYRTKNDNRFSVYFDFIHDETGAITPWMFYSPTHITDMHDWLTY
jgi:hypothetical protein